MFAVSESEYINKLGQEVIGFEISYDYLLIQIKQYIPEITMEELKELLSNRSKCNYMINGLVYLYNKKYYDC